MSLKNYDDDERKIVIDSFRLSSSISVDRLLISPNEQFLGVIFERAYNNVEIRHYLFRIYDLKTINEIAQGQWIGQSDCSEIFQHEFDRYSTYFIEVVEDMLTLIDLQNKIQKNRIIEGIQRYLDIDENGYIYALKDNCVYQYQINDKEFPFWFLLENIIEFKILPNLPSYALTRQVTQKDPWIILENMHHKNYQKRIRQYQLREEEIHCLENHFFFIEILKEKKYREFRNPQEYIFSIKLVEMRSGKIIRNLVDKRKRFWKQQLLIDSTQVTFFREDYHQVTCQFDLLRGRQKIRKFQFNDITQFSKNSFVYLEEQDEQRFLILK